jgi:2-oxoglutarate ferredoxin oxidoreductase subunit alpha
MTTTFDPVQAPPAQSNGKTVITLPSVTVRFAGDSGDGMQLAGTQFTDTSALVGNDISTLPDFPALTFSPRVTPSMRSSR